ncbi:hypothetical protein QFC24_000689 [Naganishia onofrii]|uniref:Uncharacterized protein n=1 Tax=Naganishia onofrii TaxID=1851511 RepID=A0ACC2XY64_9TREE|nr:hypothetical protein QFC24_000689 [Naganishia onofrii]
MPSTERNALDASVVEANVQSITKQVKRFFALGNEYVRGRQTDQLTQSSSESTFTATSLSRLGEGKLDVVNNHDWTVGVSLLDFLRDVGKYAKVNTMLSRER